jgi:hypothetical protein
VLCRPVLDHVCHCGRYIGTSIVSIRLLLKLSTRVVDFMPHRPSKFWRRKDFLVPTRNWVLQDTRVYSETELFCKDNGPPDLQT